MGKALGGVVGLVMGGDGLGSVKRQFMERVYTNSSWIFDYLLALTGDYSASEDLTQDVFHRAWKELCNFGTEIRNVRNWLYTITRNVAVSYSRKDSTIRKHFVPLDEVDDSELPSDPRDALYYMGSSVFGQVNWDIDQVIAGGEELERLERACWGGIYDQVESIPIKYRIPIVLHYVFDLKYADIARALGIGIRAVGNRVRDGRECFHRILGVETVVGGRLRYKLS